MKSGFVSQVLGSKQRIPLQIGVYAGLEITGASVKDAVTTPSAQAEAVLALHTRFQTDALLTAMDLSVEADAFGCTIRMEEDDIPTVIGRLVQTPEEIRQLLTPHAGQGRTAVHLEAARQLVAARTGFPVLGGVIGPFSLAGRLFGVSEALELSITDPEALTALLEKATHFLVDYVQAFRQAGAAGVIMAEPAAGLLSPRSLARFSSALVRQIIEQCQTEDFTLILHNCGARIQHLPRILEAGAEMYHFGVPMDLLQALGQVDSGVILAGNLDPTDLFYSGTPQDVRQKTLTLLNQTATYQNFVISSGCDIPPHTPVENLDAFFQTVRGWAG